MVPRTTTRRHPLAAASFALMLGLGCAGSASASLVYLGFFPSSGTGFGTQANLLTMQNTGGTGGPTDVEAGSVAWNGSGDVLTGAFTDPNPGKTATQTLGSLGLNSLTAAADLRLLFDPSETGSTAGERIDVNSLTMTIFTAAGTAFWSASLAAPVSHPALSGNGLGVADFIYGLDAVQAGDLQHQLNLLGGAGAWANYRIGLAASQSYVDDGPDTWMVSSVLSNGECIPSVANDFCGPQQIPEPGALSLVGLALLGAAGVLRRRANA